MRSEDDVRNMLDRFYDIDEECLDDEAVTAIIVLEWALFSTVSDAAITFYLPQA
jgi:hypothetical protein